VVLGQQYYAIVAVATAPSGDQLIQHSLAFPWANASAAMSDGDPLPLPLKIRPENLNMRIDGKLERSRDRSQFRA